MGRDQAKAELVEMLDRRAPSYEKLDADEALLVESILRHQATHRQSAADMVVLHNNAMAGCPLNDDVHLNTLCAIIKKLAI